MSLYVLFAEGFEEVEAITIVDVLRRAELDPTMVAAGTSGLTVKGAHGVLIQVQTMLDDVRFQEGDSLVLPGGMPGSRNLWENGTVLDLIRSVHGSTGVVAAICAAPSVLAKAGILKGRKATCYPGFENHILENGGTLAEGNVVRDRNILTSRGPATAMEFALAVAGAIGGEAIAEKVGKGLLFAA